MAVKLSPLFNEQTFDSNGDPLVGGKLYTYVAGSSTALATFTSEAGDTQQANPIILNSRGEPGNPIWLTEGSSYKFALYDADDVLIRTVDNVDGVNDASLTIDQWVASGLTPTYVSATQFTLAGDQTSTFTVNRRLKFTVTAGTVYGYVSVSAYTSLTTVTVVLDSGSLDSGLSAVSLGLITPDNTSLRVVADMLADNSVATASLQAKSVTPAKFSDDAFIVTLGASNNLVITNNATNPNYQLDIDADEIVLKDTDGRAYLAKSVNLTVDITASGANGLDTGSEASGTWYYAWVIYNGTTVAGLLSTSSTAPTLPSGYTHYAIPGDGAAIYNDASSNFIKYYQSGNTFSISSTVASSTNLTTSYVSVSLSAVVPPIAKSVRFQSLVQSASSVSSTLYYSPNNSDDLSFIGSHVAGSGSGSGSTVSGEIPIVTAQTMYVKYSGNALSGQTLRVNGGKY